MNDKNKMIKKNIHCHCFEYKKEYFIYDFYYNQIIRISRNVKKCLDYIFEDDERAKEYTEELKYIQELIDAGLLISKYENPIVDVETAYISFAPVYGCNFRCKYCFGDHGEFYLGEEKAFSCDTMKKVIKTFVFKWFPAMKYYRIDFVSGGEPLLNFEIIKETILYIEEMQQKYSINISVWLCTNGSLLNDDICRFLDKHNVSIGISIDGEKKNHDMCRVDSLGNGTYDCVVENIKKIVDNEKYSRKFRNIWALSVVSEKNSCVSKILEHNMGLGINNIQMKLVRNNKDNMSFDIINKEYEILSDKIYDEFLEGKYNIIQSISNDNDYFGKIMKRIFLHQFIDRRCWAGAYKITVCPDGSVYPCDSFVGMRDFCLGMYSDLESIDNIGRNGSVDERSKCKECSVRYICGGDCYYNSYINNGNTNEPSEKFCKIQIHIINLCIVLKLKMMEKNSTLFKRIQRILFIKEDYIKNS